ncbi:MAG: CRTAC1 family protein [Phyllobacteriaceae bacterium]|nr:CRTAC1 family protein [Phyllobacteriaceae bacterium]
MIMTPAMTSLARRAGGLVAIIPVVAFATAAHSPAPDQTALEELAAPFAFEASAMPAAGNLNERTGRDVHPALSHIAGWISSVGASVALADLDGDGLPNDYCLVDPRTDTVTVAPVSASAQTRFEPFVLATPTEGFDPATLAPMGCLPADVTGDGRMDLVVYYWGRGPVVFEARSGPPAAQSYRLQTLTDETVPWFTNAAIFADIDGDGHGDLLFGNYFADGSGILDQSGRMPANMQHSMSRAYNGGTNRLFLNAGAASGETRFEDHSAALSATMANGWTLALGAADLNGDLLPEIYVANDFGPDRLLLNSSRPGQVELSQVKGRRGFTDSRSTVLGRDSFKGMGVDFADIDGDGRLDIYVSNIAEEYALMENHFLFLHTGDDAAWQRGRAPYRNASGPLGLARSAWSWDVKLADFDNDGRVEAVQTTGFVEGATDRWPELHELAMANDELLRHAGVWPVFKDGDDLSGDHHDRFFVSDGDGTYRDIAPLIGLGGASVSRAIATADVDGDGDLDMAIARQWQASTFYENTAVQAGRSLNLDLRLQSPQGALRPAVGAVARAVLPDGHPLTGFADGGNGHSGRRSHHIHFGLGALADRDRIEVTVSWREDGTRHDRRYFLAPGAHEIVLNEQASARATTRSPDTFR